MKWLRIIFALFLIIGMLLCVSAVAYAEEGDENSPANGEETNPGEGDNPGSSLEVDIFIQGDNPNVTVGVDGDNPKVGVGVIGQNSEVTVNTTGTEVWINGRNLNQPTAVYNVQNGGGASSMGVRRVVRDVMFPYMNDIWAGLNLTAEALTKVIQMAQGHDSELGSQVLALNRHDARLIHVEGSASYLEDRASYLEGRLAALELKEGEDYAAVVELVSEMEQDYDRKLITIIGAFSLVVIGLAIGLGVLWRRTRAL